MELTVVRGSSKDATQLVRGTGGGVLLLSMRRLADVVAFCVQYELEDVMTELTGADRVQVGGARALDRSRRAYRAARAATRSRRVAQSLAPAPSTVPLDRDYELFFPVFNNAYELFALAAVPDWRRRCRAAACYINEVWAHVMPEYLLELLAEFDHVFIGVQHPVEDVARLIGRPCSYLPLGVDVLRFAPWPHPAARVIDVCNIGRRSPVTHAALLALARERRIFYYHDTVAASGGGKQHTFHVDDPAAHRLLLAGLLQRSRYFIANRGRINEPEFTQGHDEIAGRFYEGAAAGAVMLGEAPRTPEFRAQFGWPDAVIPLPFDSPDVARLLAARDADEERLARARVENVRQAARRHDWSARIRTILETVKVAVPAALRAREERLHALASEFHF